MSQTSSQSLYDTFSRIGLRFERGDGPWLYTTLDERYLDFTSGIAVNSLGHAHPHLVEKLKQQVEKLWHVSNLFENPGQEKLADILCQNSFAEKVFFCNSGAEAMECAIKTARRYHFNNGAPERNEIITFEGAFHGRTLATLAAGGQQKYLEGFGPTAGGFIQVPFGDTKALEAVINEKTAAILIEPIQGESGIRPVSHETLVYLRELCDKNGLLLIFDEVQTGVGRTGKLFAHQWSSITPDIMGIAKGIGGGFPLGACLATKEAAKGMTAGTHGTTFGGNPLATTAGIAVLDVMLEQGFLDQVIAKGNVLKQGLVSLLERYSDIFSNISGQGLLIGMHCVVPNTDVIAACREEKLLTVGAGHNVMRLLPPLNITEDTIHHGLNQLEKAAKKLSLQKKDNNQ